MKNAQHILSDTVAEVSGYSLRFAKLFSKNCSPIFKYGIIRWYCLHKSKLEYSTDWNYDVEIPVNSSFLFLELEADVREAIKELNWSNIPTTSQPDKSITTEVGVDTSNISVVFLPDVRKGVDDLKSTSRSY